MQTDEKPWKWLGIGAAVGLVLVGVLACMGLIVFGPSVIQHASLAPLVRGIEAVREPLLPVADTPAPAVTPVAEVVASPTAEAMAPTPTPMPMPALDITDISESVAWLIDLVRLGEADRVTALVGPDGAQVVSYGVGVDYLGHDNGEEIARQLEGALAQSDPVLEGCDVCIGCMPDKVTVWYTGMASLEASTGDCIGTGFSIWELDGRWQLVFITCLEWDDWVLSTLDDCAALP